MKVFNTTSFLLASNTFFPRDNPYEILIEEMDSIEIQSTIELLANCKKVMDVETLVIWKREFFPSCYILYKHEINCNSDPFLNSIKRKSASFECKYIEETPLPLRATVANENNTETSSIDEMVTIKMVKSLVYRYTASYNYKSLVKFVKLYKMADFAIELTEENEVITSYVDQGMIVIGERIVNGKYQNLLRYTSLRPKDDIFAVKIQYFDLDDWKWSSTLLKCNLSDCATAISSASTEFNNIDF